MERDGPNRLAEASREARWKAFLRQFKDLLIIILLIAAVVSLVVNGEWETPVVIAAVVLLNATIGFVQVNHGGKRGRTRHLSTADTPQSF